MRHVNDEDKDVDLFVNELREKNDGIDVTFVFLSGTSISAIASMA